MSLVVASTIGFLLGSLPTATTLGRLWGIDLLSAGSSNPGANNAWRLGGRGLGATVLSVEVAKGAAAVVIGAWVAGPPGAAIGGVAACVGNLLNPWLRFRGGQGLGMAAGVMLAAWPVGLLAVLVLVASVARLARSAHVGALSGVAGLALGAVVRLPAPWGLDGGPLRLLTLGVALALAPKQIRRLIRRRAT